MSEITKDEVLKVANLARLDIPQSELKSYFEELQAILKHIDKLERLDTSSIEPLASPLPNPGYLSRKDLDHATDDSIKHFRQTFMDGAPQKEANFFRVPQINKKPN